MRHAEQVLRREHLALKGIYRVLKMEASRLRGNQTPDFPVLEAIVEYIREFPDRIHHPKEEQHVFRAACESAVRKRRLLLDVLFREHEQETRLIAELQKTLQAFQGRPTANSRGLPFCTIWLSATLIFSNIT